MCNMVTNPACEVLGIAPTQPSLTAIDMQTTRHVITTPVSCQLVQFGKHAAQKYRCQTRVTAYELANATPLVSAAVSRANTP
jgi:hypothetical protein